MTATLTQVRDCEPGEVGGGSQLSPSAQPSHLRVGTVWRWSARCRGQGAEEEGAVACAYM